MFDERVREAEGAKDALYKKLQARPTRQGHKPTDEERARWAEEDALYPRLLAEYRDAVAKARPRVACGEPREGGCNHRWGVTCVCQRAHGHAPPRPEPGVTRPPSAVHTCRCGAERRPSPEPTRQESPADPTPPPTPRPAQQHPVVGCPNRLVGGGRCGEVAFMGTDREGRRLLPGHRRCWACGHIWSPSDVRRDRATALMASTVKEKR